MAALPPIRVIPRAEMMKRVAFFDKLKGSMDGLPDSPLPECRRELVNVIGFQPPPVKESEEARVSPVGTQNAEASAINIAEGFNMGFARAKPGCGPLMHNHDTNETFMPISGRWRCEWNEGKDLDFVDLGPCDVVSFPPGMARRFMNITHDEPDKEHVLLFIIAGDAPSAEFTAAAMARVEEFHKTGK